VVERREKNQCVNMGWKALVSAFVLLMVLAAADPAWAHRLTVYEEEPGVLRVHYEGDIPAPAAVVALYDAREALLLEGQVDAQGYFRYDHARFPAVSAAADDGMGHRVFIRLDAGPPAEIPLAVRTVFGLSLLLFVLSFFGYWSRRKKSAAAPGD